jgi:ABC-type phosphate transport system substrate-binding protein
MWNNAAEAQFSVKLVGSGGAATAGLYNSYGAYYGYSKDNVALTYTASSVEDALVKYEQNLVDFVGADTALDPEQFNGVQGLAQLPIVGLPLVIGYNLPTLLPSDSLVRPPPSPVPQTNFLRFEGLL